MQLIASKTDYYIKSVKSILTVSRLDGSFNVIQHVDLSNIHCSLNVIGEVEGIIGKLKINEHVYLFLITNSTKVAYKERTKTEIKRIDKAICICITNDEKIVLNINENKNHLDKIKNSQRKLIQFVSSKKNNYVQPKIIDEILRLLNDNGDFYYETNNGDITKSIQRASSSKDKSPEEQFYWNKNLLSEIDSIRYPEWILPIVQGFVIQKNLRIEEQDIHSTDLTLTLISRRSTKRAGMRYLRRGIDDDGNVANFVETEFIINVFGHELAFVQIRGSVPLYWSQTGSRYRPPLNIDKEMNDSIIIFKKHMNNLETDYGTPIIGVNLVNQTGRELCLAKAYLEHILELNDENIGYFSFDFHYNCRALKFYKVNNLIKSMNEILNNIGYCWIDKSGDLVLKQSGIIRTNCVDCLDRTNVVQNFICQYISIKQFKKLGIITSLNDEIPEILQLTIQEMWADNGDAISKQYAGTDALKGDITRSGQRKLTGLVKDGYSSASRYYLSHMRDSQKQQAIDTFILAKYNDNIEQRNLTDEINDDENESENIKRLVHETVTFVLPENEILVGGWALVDGDNNNELVDSILLLTRTHVYIAQYEEQSDKLTNITTILFDEISKIELGYLGKNIKKHIRIYWKCNNQIIYDTWRAAKTRLFNNVAIPIKNDEEANEYVQAISEQLKITISMCINKTIPVYNVNKLSGTANNNHSVKNLFTDILNKTKKQQNVSKEKPIVTVFSNEQLDKQQNEEKITHTQSENLLTSNNSSLVSKLSVNLKKGQFFKKSNPDLMTDEDIVTLSTTSVNTNDPFQQYKDQILSSKSLIQML